MTLVENQVDIDWIEVSRLKTEEAEKYEINYRNKGNRQTKKDAAKKRKSKRKMQRKARK